MLLISVIQGLTEAESHCLFVIGQAVEDLAAF